MHNPRLQWMNYLTNRWTSRLREKKRKKNSFENRKINFLKMLSTDDNWTDKSSRYFVYWLRTNKRNRWILLKHHVLFFIRPPVIRGYRIWLFPLRDYRSCGLSRLRNCIRISIQWDESNMEGSELLLELSFSKLSNFFFL